MPNKYFNFKQFTINQDKCAFKVGTDGVLLGAWAQCSNAKQVLDIGTGTGLISLMIAQRSNAKIIAVEIDESSYLQARENIENSKWENRIEIFHISFQDFYLNTSRKFDTIVSNPPYFENALKSTKTSKNISRHNDELPFDNLIQGVSKLLNEKGNFALILPVEMESKIDGLCQEYELYPEKKCLVKPTLDKDPKRILISYSQQKKSYKTDTISIEFEKRHSYSKEYMSLTQNFYLHF